MDELTSTHRRAKRKRWLLLAIVLIAAFLRFYRIDSLPPGDGYDPAFYGVDALRILDGEFPIFLPSNIGREVMFSYIVAGCVAIFGIGPHAIHIASAIVGVVTVPATYAVAESLFANARARLLRTYGGLVSAAALATSFWHLHWSRYGVRAILVPLFAALTITAMVRGFHTTKRWRFILAGLMLGLSFYTYQSARTLPALVVIGFVVYARYYARRQKEKAVTAQDNAPAESDEAELNEAEDRPDHTVRATDVAENEQQASEDAAAGAPLDMDAWPDLGSAPTGDDRSAETAGERDELEDWPSLEEGLDDWPALELDDRAGEAGRAEESAGAGWWQTWRERRRQAKAQRRQSRREAQEQKRAAREQKAAERERARADQKKKREARQQQRTGPVTYGFLWSLNNLLLIILAALLVFLPLGNYFLTHPGSGNERIDQTFILDPTLGWRDNLLRLRHEVVDAFLVLAVHGDEEPIHNLPGRAAMNPFLLALFGVGFILALARLRHPPYLVLLAWLPVMSITVFLTLGGQPTKRALGALPAITGLIAVGALVPLDALRRWSRQRKLLGNIASGIWIAVLAAGAGYSIGATYRDYFVTWGGDPNLFTHFETGRAAIGQYARSRPPEETIYISPELASHPSIVYNAGARPDLKSYNGRLCIVFPAVTTAPTTYLIVQHEDRNSLDRLATYFPVGEQVPAGPAWYGQPYFTAYRIPENVRAQWLPDHAAIARWQTTLQVLGYDLSAERVAPGEVLTLNLYYGALKDVQQNYIVFTHLLGPENPASGNNLWAQDDSEPCRTFYPTSAWSEGEIIRDTFTLNVPGDAPPGLYRLQMGFYTWPEMAHLTTTDGPGDEAQITFVLGEVTVGAPE
jgi:hypothetical protein